MLNRETILHACATSRAQSDSYYPANGVDQNDWDERNESIEREKVSPDASDGGK
jgi:hypothetical protein